MTDHVGLLLYHRTQCHHLTVDDTTLTITCTNAPVDSTLPLYPLTDDLAETLNVLPFRLMMKSLPHFELAVYLLPSEVWTRLTTLVCRDTFVVSLFELPPSLITFDGSNSRLTDLPDLPSTLERLRCDCNCLTALPGLPSNLQELNCANNQLSTLPELPVRLRRLNVNHNQLTSLPSLPELECLGVCGNQLTSLPALPVSLKELYVYDNPLTVMPPMSYDLWVASTLK